ncbi:MAG: polysaccharide biosynthesis C-terminal domain-containing protein, partial [Deltaproteobacteria bacterium]|nr:polysaccharide biosynthesis C-terminal domain-containing protein [Deltaproteobacteria bacterium]
MIKATPVNMGEDRVFQVLLRLGAPAMISMFFETLYALVDTIFVAQLGTIPLAAMSLALPLFFIGMALSKGIAVGAMAMMSHARGRENQAEVEKVARAVYPLAFLAIGGLLFFALPGCGRSFFALFDQNPVLLHETAAYTRWLALSFPGLAWALVCEAVLFSHGDTKTPMLAMIAGNLLNMVLDPLLIFSCGLGIGGASLASLLGWLLSGLIMWRALVKKGLARPALKISREFLPTWSQIVGLGAPVA